MKTAAAAEADLIESPGSRLPSTPQPTIVRRRGAFRLRDASAEAPVAKRRIGFGRASAAAAGLAIAIGLTSLTIWVGRGLPNLDDIPYLKHEVVGVGRHDPSSKTAAGEPRQFVQLNAISPYIPQALVAAEDRRFYSHFGIDPLSLIRALYADLRAGRIVQGGSTITEQLAKNLLPKSTSPIHKKLQEMALAVELERRFTKKQILELYLNKVYFGSGTYGLAAAARLYFDLPPQKLDLYDSALLIGILPAPSRFNPRHDPLVAARRARVILHDMVETRALTQKQAQDAIATHKLHESETPHHDG